jgi:signal transduction histidine kinase/CheY-like chemotaxis protein
MDNLQPMKLEVFESWIEGFDSLPVGVSVLSESNEILSWNACLEQWTGLKRQSVIGKNLLAMLSWYLNAEECDRLLIWLQQCSAPSDTPSVNSFAICPTFPQGRSHVCLLCSAQRLSSRPSLPQHYSQGLVLTWTPQPGFNNSFPHADVQLSHPFQSPVPSQHHLERQLKQVRFISDITQEIRRSLDIHQGLQTTANQLGKTFQVTACLISAYEATPQSKLIPLVEYRDEKYPSALEFEIPLDHNPHAQRMFQSDEAIACSDVLADPMLSPVRELCQQLQLRSLLTVRTSYQGEPNGCICLHQCDRLREWTEEDIELLEGVANQVGIALAQKQLLDKEHQRQQELLTKNNALEEARWMAEAANRAKSDFLATMSHEIRTPMNAVIGMTELLQATSLTSQQQDFVETIRMSGEALMAIVNDVLDFSKIEAGKVTLDEKPFHLRTCLEESLDLLAPKATAKGLELAYIMRPGIPEMILGDITRFRQILVNLLSNAVKFTERGEVTVTVTARQLERHPKHPTHTPTSTDHLPCYAIQFAVQDTGIGIPSNRLSRLFQPFTQVNPSMNQNYGGTGLGLTISQRLSEMMGGRIWVDSEPGRGSTFHVSVVVRAMVKSHDLASVDHAEFQGKRILIVEDHDLTAQNIKLQLQQWGMDVVVVMSEAAMLSYVHGHPHCDGVLIDVQMLSQDGRSLIEVLRTQPHYEAVPLVVLEPMVSQSNQGSRRLSEGICSLTKPIKHTHLHHVLLQILAPHAIHPHNVMNGRVDRLGAIAKKPMLPSNTSLRILVAEDNLVNQKVILHLLKRLGYDAMLAATGLEVLQNLEGNPYDVVLMDLQMPEMDGLTVTRHIREHFPASNQPYIIALTANAMQSDRDACIEAGMNDYLSKPIRLESLIQALERSHQTKSVS